ncbi:oligomeric, coiled-coil, peripheral membrane protein [Umbelopsis sp. WA50703]
MKVYRAETGQIVGLRGTDISVVNSLDGLRRLLEKYTGVPASAQILMTSFGTQVKQDMVKDVVQAKGKDEYILIIYDRQYLDASHDEVMTLIEVEMPKFQPSPNSIDGTSALRSVRAKCSAAKSNTSKHFELYYSLFQDFEGYTQTALEVIKIHTSIANNIVAEQKAQSMALNVALTNLEAHVRVSSNKFKGFQIVANRDFSQLLMAVENVSRDLEVLQMTQVHPLIRDALSRDRHIKYLSELLDEQSILKTKSSIANTRNILVEETQELASLIDDIQQGEVALRQQSLSDFDLQALDTRLVDVREVCEKAEFLRDKIERDFARVHDKIQDIMPLASNSRQFSDQLSKSPDRQPFFQPSPPLTLPSHAKKTLEAFDHLAEIHVKDYLPKIVEYEQVIRNHLSMLIKSKRRAMEGFLRQMNVISHLQSEIAAVSPRIDAVDKEMKGLKKQAGKDGLQKPRLIILAYGALIIEIVRRKEYANILLENANVIADLFGRFRMNEQNRRDHYRTEYAKLTPFQIEAMDDTASYCEVSASNIRDRGPNLNRDDVNQFLLLIKEYLSNNDIQSAMGSPLGQLSSRVQSPYNHQTSPLNTSYTLKGSSPSMSRNPSQSRAFDSKPEKIINQLMSMNDDLNALRHQFLESVDKSYFQDQKFAVSNGQNRRISAPVMPTSRVSSPIIVSESEAMFVQKTRALDIADDKIKTYEDRIRMLEEALQKANQPSNPNSLGESVVLGRAKWNEEGTAIAQQQHSSSSSFYSVADDNWTKKQIGELYVKLQEADKKNSDLERQLLKQRSSSSSICSQRSDVSHNWDREKIEWEKYQEYNEHEKEDLRLQIQNLEQLLEEERQTFEENRKSLLKEAQIRDNLADIRIAGAEGDWKTRIEELEENLRKQQEESDLMRANYEKEIRILKESHNQELSAVQHEHESKALELKVVNDKLVQLTKQVEDLHEAMTAEKEASKEQIRQMQEEMDNSEQARDEIKQRLAQARDMVAAAEDDWMAKNTALEKIVDDQSVLKGIVYNIASKAIGEQVTELDQETPFLELLEIVDKSLNTKTEALEGLRLIFNELQSNHKQLEEDFDDLSEKHTALRKLCSQMAMKLVDVRLSVFGEITNQLQLPVDENEASNLVRRLSFESNIDSSAAFAQWAETLHSINGVDLSKFVFKVRKKVKDAHDLTRRWQKEYKDLKDKYGRTAAESYEKIAFRNFKVGDVALFLPTRNSTGKPWAAFNINAPHFFLKPTDNIISQMSTREWIVARITSITENVVDYQIPSSNPYGLSDGFKFYQLEVENWRNGHHRKGHRSQSGKDKDKDGQTSSSSKSPTMQNSTMSVAQSQTEQNTQMTTSKELSNGRRYTLPYVNGKDTGLAGLADEPTNPSSTSPGISTRRMSFERQPTVTSPVFRRPGLSSHTTMSGYLPMASSTSGIVSNTMAPSNPETSSLILEADYHQNTDDKLELPSSIDQSSLIWAAQE